MSEQTEIEKLDISPFELMVEMDQYRGSQILKLGDLQTIDVKVLDVYAVPLREADLEQKKDKDWFNTNLSKMQEQGWEHDYIPNIVLELETLTKAMDKDGNPITTGTKMIFQREAKNTFWRSIRALGFTTEKKLLGKTIRLLKLQGARGTTTPIPISPTEA